MVREILDTLYMARRTLLGITGLDSSQEIAEKSVNETAITRRISKAINIIEQSEQYPLSEEQSKLRNKEAWITRAKRELEDKQ